MRRLVTMIAVVSALLVTVPALAVDETLSLEIEGIVRGDVGEIIEVATADVPEHLVGGFCSAGTVETDQGSNHPGNDYIVTSGTTSAIIPDFEAAGGAVVPMQGEITLGTSLKVEVQLGPDEVSSGGFTVIFECTPLGEGRFVDDDHTVFENDIEWIAERGITKGCNPPLNDRYCPDDTVTRGQMAAFLVRALDLTDRIEDRFIDDDGSTFEVDIEKLAAAGITLGCNPPENDRFCPDDDVTREQMAALLTRAMGYTDAGLGDLFIDDDASTFELDIDRLATAGVTKGCNPPENTKFCPTEFVTRGEMAAFLHRALK